MRVEFIAVGVDVSAGAVEGVLSFSAGRWSVWIWLARLSVMRAGCEGAVVINESFAVGAGVSIALEGDGGVGLRLRAWEIKPINESVWRGNLRSLD